jgi:hypothetical protein
MIFQGLSRFFNVIFRIFQRFSGGIRFFQVSLMVFMGCQAQIAGTRVGWALEEVHGG